MNIWKKIKFWATDFDKKEALVGLFPIFVVLLISAVMLIALGFKFRHVLWGRISN